MYPSNKYVATYHATPSHNRSKGSNTNGSVAHQSRLRNVHGQTNLVGQFLRRESVIGGGVVLEY